MRVELYSRRLAGDRSIQHGALAKAGLTPTVQDSVDQVVRHGVVLGDTLMALLAFPRAKNPCYLFEYSSHLCLTVTSLPTPFKSICSMLQEQPGVF